MKEIGGYIELDQYRNEMLHENAVKLNCGRNALAYLIEANNIKKIAIPRFMCGSCDAVLEKYGVEKRLYNIGWDFKPVDIELQEDEWLYIVNFYGQLMNDYIADLKEKHGRLIADYSHAYFQRPMEGVDTLYTCRKFFGVPDGAILYTSKLLERNLQRDESYGRMRHLLGRFERTASEFYEDYVEGEKSFESEPLKRMSRLTENLLHGIDYDAVKNIRMNNFGYLDRQLVSINRLALLKPDGAFMYPLYLSNGAAIRKKLHAQKIYIPTLWPSVFGLCKETDIEYIMAENILPLPVDQRYGIDDMQYLVKTVLECVN